MSWLSFALMTVAAWGVYGVLLHQGRLGMGGVKDPNALYRAFLFVGIAYFLTAVLAPMAVLVSRGAPWNMPTGGMAWSLVAGIAGAAGAFCTLLAFGAKGNPAVVMAIVFGGAPIVNAIVATLVHPPVGGLSTIKLPFVLGLLMAAAGGVLVTMYRPVDAPAPSAHPVAEMHAAVTPAAEAKVP